jgi:hypothetical protein
MKTTSTTPRPAGGKPCAGALPYHDAPSARDFIVALGRIYLAAGLPLSAAFEAAFADYRSFGVPCQCET